MVQAPFGLRMSLKCLMHDCNVWSLLATPRILVTLIVSLLPAYLPAKYQEIIRNQESDDCFTVCVRLGSSMLLVPWHVSPSRCFTTLRGPCGRKRVFYAAFPPLQDHEDPQNNSHHKGTPPALAHNTTTTTVFHEISFDLICIVYPCSICPTDWGSASLLRRCFANFPWWWRVSQNASWSSRKLRMESRTVCWDLISLWELTVSYQHGGWFKFGIPCRFRKPSKTKICEIFAFERLSDLGVVAMFWGLVLLVFLLYIFAFLGKWLDSMFLCVQVCGCLRLCLEKSHREGSVTLKTPV